MENCRIAGVFAFYSPCNLILTRVQTSLYNKQGGHFRAGPCTNPHSMNVNEDYSLCDIKKINGAKIMRRFFSDLLFINLSYFIIELFRLFHLLRLFRTCDIMNNNKKN